MTDLKYETTAERWAALIKECMDSEMTIKEWCQEQNIKESQYYYWLKILRQGKVVAAERNLGTASFVELPTTCLEPEAAHGKTAAVIRKGNVSVEITEYASAGFIAKILEAAANAW